MIIQAPVRLRLPLVGGGGGADVPKKFETKVELKIFKFFSKSQSAEN